MTPSDGHRARGPPHVFDIGGYLLWLASEHSDPDLGCALSWKCYLRRPTGCAVLVSRTCPRDHRSTYRSGA